MDIIGPFRGDYYFLSNFSNFNNPICETIEGKELCYNTVEHAYQASKSLDYKTRLRFSLSSNPVEAKKMGRHIELRDDWDKVHLDVMYIWLTKKFYQETMALWLLSTGDKYLAEINWWNDTYWGMTEDLKGENNLGRLLMKIIEELKDFY